MTRSASLRTVILAALALVAAADDGPNPNNGTSCHRLGGAHVKR